MLGIAPDKWLHIYAGIPLAYLLMLSFQIAYPKPAVFEIAMTMFMVAVVAYGFELFSLITGLGVYDGWDALATWVGGFLGVGLAVISFYSKKKKERLYE